MEPGCYFIDAMLVPAMEDAVTSKFLNKKEIEKYKKFGGVRIESDVVSHLLNLQFIWSWWANNINVSIQDMLFL